MADSSTIGCNFLLYETCGVMRVEHKEWISIYKQRPEDGEKCVSRIAGEEGYAGSTIYDAKSSTFRTYEDCRNRFIITVWKHDEWYSV